MSFMGVMARSVSMFHRHALPNCFRFNRVCTSPLSIFLNRRSFTCPPPYMVVNTFSGSNLLWGLHGGRLLNLHSPSLNLLPDERIIGSSKGWLVITKHCNPSHLFNPISKQRVQIPHFSGTVYRVTLSTPPTTGDCILVLSGCINDCTICFAWCRPGDSKWTFFDVDLDLWTGDGGGDMMFCNGKLNVVSGKGEFHIFDFNPVPKNLFKKNPVPKKIGAGSFANISQRSNWSEKEMVQSGADLLLVGRRRPRNVDSFDMDAHLLDVFKQAEEPDKWVRVESLGDRVLLIGNKIGFTAESFSVQDLIGSGFEANCIYFPHYPYCANIMDFGKKIDLVKFSVADGSIQRIPIPTNDHALHTHIEWIVPQA